MVMGIVLDSKLEPEHTDITERVQSLESHNNYIMALSKDRKNEQCSVLMLKAMVWKFHDLTRLDKTLPLKSLCQSEIPITNITWEHCLVQNQSQRCTKDDS